MDVSHDSTKMHSLVSNLRTAALRSSSRSTSRSSDGNVRALEAEAVHAMSAWSAERSASSTYSCELSLFWITLSKY